MKKFLSASVMIFFITMGCGGRLGVMTGEMSDSDLANLVPSLLELSNQSSRVNIQYSEFLEIDANPNNFNITFCSHDSNPAGISLNSETGELSWTPDNSLTGVYNLFFYISITGDCEDTVDFVNFELEIINEPPDVTSSISSPASVAPSTWLEFDFYDYSTDSDTDFDGDPIAYSCLTFDNVIDGVVEEPSSSCDSLVDFTLNPATGEFSWLAPDVEGTYEFKFLASDGFESDTIIFAVNVTALGGGPPVSPE